MGGQADAMWDYGQGNFCRQKGFGYGAGAVRWRDGGEGDGVIKWVEGEVEKGGGGGDGWMRICGWCGKQVGMLDACSFLPRRHPPSLKLRRTGSGTKENQPQRTLVGAKAPAVARQRTQRENLATKTRSFLDAD